MEQRQLKQGAAGWVLLAGLGVAYVISGDFAGWNFGLAEGGWGGLLIATIADGDDVHLHGLRRWPSCRRRSPTAGGGYGFARRALGPLGGFLTGTAILIEYAIAPAAIVVFIGGYVESLDIFGISAGWPVYLAFYAVFVGIHLVGVGEALKVMFVITAIAVVGAARVRGRDGPRVRRVEPDRHRRRRTPPARATSCRSATRASGPRSRTRSGSSWRSRACRWPPRRRATPSATCRAG